jgi:D-sedoheptulose 7-phosphate isomerase
VAERADFLYPFLQDGDAGPAAADPVGLLDDLAASAVAKGERSARLRSGTLAAQESAIGTAGQAMASRFAAGGQLLTFGNGGSSTDAASLADLFVQPPWGPCRPARCLVEDQAVVTALANDVGFDLVFSRQIIAHGRGIDMALGISTSGNSRNVLVALEEAATRGLLTVGLAGYRESEMQRSPHVDHFLWVDSDSIHRIQETQAAVGFALWSVVQSPHRPATGG